MDENTFKEGQEIHAIYFPNESQVMVGQAGIDKITVVLEYGQMAGVPWFAAWTDGKMVSKYNSVYVESVTF